MREVDDGTIRRYLLGLLPEAEADALEDSYFADPETFERVRGVEDDLLDDYAAARLGPSDAAALERRYLASPLLRQRLEAARALKRAAAAPSPAPARARLPRWLGPFAIAAALAVAVVGVVITMRARPSPPVESASPSQARAETPTPSPPPSSTAATTAAAPTPGRPSLHRVVLALSPTLLRGEGGAAEARLPPRTEALLLELRLQPSELEGSPALRATVETVGGTRVWSGPAQRVQERENLAAEVAVPVARLPAGDYLVTLDAAGETVHRYFFRVLAR